MPADRLADWTTADLYRFVQQMIRDDDTVNAPNKTIDELTVGRKLILTDEMQFSNAQTTVGSAGAASALPATPEFYTKVLGPNGQTYLLPLYKV